MHRALIRRTVSRKPFTQAWDTGNTGWETSLSDMSHERVQPGPGLFIPASIRPDGLRTSLAKALRPSAEAVLGG